MTSAIGRKPDAARIIELKKKILDEEYISYAIQRIAQVLSNQLLDYDGEAHERHR
jgi:hypothetical protein